jgi:hypothetical protein
MDIPVSTARNLKDLKVDSPDMPLPDEHTSKVDRLGHARLENKILEAALQEVLDSQRQDVIDLALALVQKTVAIQPPEKGLAFEDPTWILLVQGEEHSSIVTNPTEHVLNPPELSLAAQSILSHQLQLCIQTLFLIWTAGFLKCLPICK